MRRLVLFGALALAACGHAPADAPSSHDALSHMRSDGASSTDGEIVGRWQLSEMFLPGGDAKQAAAARARLDKVGRTGMWSGLARALADDAHGEPKAAADGYVEALAGARASHDPDAPLVGWVAARALRGLTGSVANLYETYRTRLEAMTADPQALGWRAVTELEEWRVAEVFDRAEATGDAYEALVSARLGCARKVKLAGPFGHGAPADRRHAFPAEEPGPWPVAWAADPERGSVPRQLAVEQHRCDVVSTEATQDGIFYAQTFFEAKGDRELFVAIDSAVKVWVDDVPVLVRDPSEWGSAQRDGAHFSVHAGRHRILARVLAPVSGIRLLNIDGTAAGVATDADDSQPYSLDAPHPLGDPNPLDGIVQARATSSPLESVLAAYAAHADGLDDVSMVLLEPLLSKKDSAAGALLLGAECSQGDPALPEDKRLHDAKSMRELAAARDPKLWFARTTLVLDEAEQRGPADAVAPLRALADEFTNEPHVLEQLARTYSELGWRAERMRTLQELATRFPDDVPALRSYLDALDDDGALADADRIAARIQKLDPDSEVDLDRAVAREDWKGAVAELRRLAKRRPDRKEIAARIADVLLRGGDPSAALAQLEKALAKHPRDSAARFSLADRKYARGDASALRTALAVALQIGASTTELRAAIDLIEGATDLEPYRIDGMSTVRDYEAWRKQGHEMEGTAARVLDYGVTWIHEDGSSEMLEHEIQRIQSQQAINEEAEINPPDGLVLHLRVIKPDGTTLEPDHVNGKQTLTMPHLEVGDYVEVEHITPLAGDGQRGKRYRGPTWFFREPDKGYWRSAFVVIVPKDKPVEIESNGDIGKDDLVDMGILVRHRWQVNLSPPAVLEPDGPPATEFLPSVRLGWGVELHDWLARLAAATTLDTPIDPRLEARARTIVAGVPATAIDERARLLYRWVVEKVQDGKESDGRRVVTGLSGSRQAAYTYLLHALGIPWELAVVKNRLASPTKSRMGEVEEYDNIVLRIGAEQGPRWLTVRDKFTPYGYVPAEMRGQPCFRLIEGTPPDVVRAPGTVDAVSYSGRADVKPDGSALMDLVLTFSGNRAIGARAELDKVPEGRLLEFLEKEIVATTFDGGHVRDAKIDNQANVDAPLVLKMKVEAPSVGKVVDGGLSLRSVFPISLSGLAALPTRTTALLRRASWHTEVHFEIIMASSMKMPASIPQGEIKDGDASVSIKDTVNGHSIAIERVIDLPAGRVAPGEEYARFRQFVRDADALLDREIRVGR
jgi:tetratricopeptide (TPR) repeat protein